MSKIHELLEKAFRYAKLAHASCYYDLDADIPADYAVALSHAANCTSCYAAAAALYLVDPDLDDENISKILRQFEIVTREVRTVYGQTQRNMTGLHVELDYLEDLLKENGHIL